MARQKKQYRPIAGQKRWEKILDWMTQEENFRYFSILPWLYLFLFLAVPAHIATFIIKRPDTIDLILSLWPFGFVPVIIIAFINPFAAGWGLRMEENLQQPIKGYVEQHGSCTYDELIVQFMPVKIHLGIDDALEQLLRSRELVSEDNLYRLPTDEDRRNWHSEWLAEYGVKISFEDLEKLFSLELNEEEDNTSIGFSLIAGGDYWIWKGEDETSGATHFFFSSESKDQQHFATFQELAAADLFDGQSLRSVWGDAVLTIFNDHEDIEWWLEKLLY